MSKLIKTQPGWSNLLLWVLSMLTFGMILPGCDIIARIFDSKPPAQNGSSAQTGNNASLPPAHMKRHLTAVLRNDTELSKDSLYELQNGDRIRTNDGGEGWLYLSNCQTVYLFQQSGLIKSANSKADSQSGSSTNLYNGSAVVKDSKCAGQVVIQTDGAEIRLTGTWVSVTYLPVQQLTLVMVFEGAAEFQAVLDSKLRTLDQAVKVPSGYFLFSTRGNRSKSVAGLAAQKPHSFQQLPGLLAELNLWKWIPRIRDRARMDNIPFPEFLVAQCTVKGTNTVTAWRLRQTPVGGAVVGEMTDNTPFVAMARTTDTSSILGATAKQIGWVSANAVLCEANLAQLPKILDLPPTPEPSSPEPSPSEPIPEEPSEPELPRPPRRPLPEPPYPVPPIPQPPSYPPEPGPTVEPQSPAPAPIPSPDPQPSKTIPPYTHPEEITYPQKATPPPKRKGW